MREEYRLLPLVFQKLDISVRRILALVVRSRLSFREITVVTGFSEANGKLKMHRTRAKLKRLTAEVGQEEASDKPIHRS